MKCVHFHWDHGVPARLIVERASDVVEELEAIHRIGEEPPSRIEIFDEDHSLVAEVSALSICKLIKSF
jgi:hypothetical protein